MWSTELVRRAKGDHTTARAPVLLYRLIGGAQSVAACCAIGRARGVVAGMSIAHARALLHPGEAAEALVAPLDPHRDAEALRRLARWAMRFTPVVAIDEPDGLLLDVTGCRRLFRGETRLLRQLIDGLDRLGFTGRAAIAPTFAAAWAVARYATERGDDGDGRRGRKPHARGAGEWIVEPAMLRTTLDPLPIAALRLPAEQVDLLAAVEVRRIEHLLSLSRAQLAARFGLALLRRIDEAMGVAPEVLTPLREEAPPRAEREFESPVMQPEALALAARGLLEEVVTQLHVRNHGVRRLVLELRHADSSRSRSTLILARPTRRSAHLWTLLAPRLEAIDLDDGTGARGCDHLALTAAATSLLPPIEWSCWVDEGLPGPDGAECETLNAESAEAELIDLYTARFGADRVQRLQPMAAHLPELTVKMRSALERISARALAAPLEEAPRPTLLLRPPQRVRVLCRADGATPRQLEWRGMSLPLEVLSGPERIDPPWWPPWWGASGAPTNELRSHGPRANDPAPHSRDYWRVIDSAGRALWIFEVRAQRAWFVHGVWG